MIIFLILIFSFIISIQFNDRTFSFRSTKKISKVLVIYVYAESHSFSLSNLKYFLRFGMKKCSNIDYYIIIQQMNNTKLNQMNLPLLPSNGHYVEHENECFDLGTIGWFLSKGITNKNRYKYFIFLNSSVRGPYLVSYYEENQWEKIFTNRLNDYVKLVGPTISCQASPHVQSYFWAMDRIALDILLNDSEIFSCHQTQVDAIYRGEIPASRLLFNNGFTIGSLMKKYQKIDFLKDGTRDCLYTQNPTGDKQVDGISLDPFEIVFVKFKSSSKDLQDLQQRISVYDRWVHF